VCTSVVGFLDLISRHQEVDGGAFAHRACLAVSHAAVLQLLMLTAPFKYTFGHFSYK